MIPDFLFSPSQSPVFSLLKVLVSPSQSPCFALLKVPFSPSSKSRFFFLRVTFSSSPSPLPSSQSPLPSSPIPVPFLSVLLLPLKVLFPPLPPSQRKQRNDTKPSRRSWWLVPKWNISGSEGLPNNPLNNVDNSYHSTR